MLQKSALNASAAVGGPSRHPAWELKVDSLHKEHFAACRAFSSGFMQEPESRLSLASDCRFHWLPKDMESMPLGLVDHMLALDMRLSKSVELLLQ